MDSEQQIKEMKNLLGSISQHFQIIAGHFEKFHTMRDEFISLDHKLNPPPYAVDAQPSGDLSEPYLADPGEKGNGNAV